MTTAVSHSEVKGQGLVPPPADCWTESVPVTLCTVRSNVPIALCIVRLKVPVKLSIVRLNVPMSLQSLIISDGFQAADRSNFTSVLPWKPNRNISIELWQRPL